MRTDHVQYAADHADMKPTVTITRMGKLWCLTWSEPRNVVYSLLCAYQVHCADALVPSLRARWPAWAATVSRSSKMVLGSGSFGYLHHAPEAVIHEAVAIIRAVFPRAVVAWPKTRASRQTCDRCASMSGTRTCTQPSAAGLADKGLPIWCDLMNGHGRTCPAFSTTTKG